MNEHTQIYGRVPENEEEPMELDDVLEPYDEADPEESGYDHGFYAAQPGDDPYGEYDDYSDEHEALDSKSRFRVAMSVFDTISILVGVVTVLVLVAMLVSLVNWLRSDILHSVLLLQSGLQ